MTFRPNPKHPYAHAARLPEGEGRVRFDEVLSGEGPIEIEIGPGRGTFVFERLRAAPEVRILALEIRLKWAATVDARLVKAGLSHRARVLGEDAKRALPRLEPAGSVRAAFLHFPDPWWKKRHEKRLVMGDVLLDELSRLLHPGGLLFVQTDVEERAAQYEAQIAAHGSFEPDAPAGARVDENPFGARSNREHRAITDGLPVHRLLYRRRATITA